MLGIVADDGVLEDGFAGAGLAEDEAEAALLGVDLEDVEVALLVFEQGRVVLDGEGLVAEAEVGFDHSVGRLFWSMVGVCVSEIVPEVGSAVVGEHVE